MEHEVLKAALAPGAGCPPLEQLGRYADDALGPDEQAVVAHIGGCLNCQAELALLRAVTSGGVRAEEADVVREGVARLEARAPEIFGAGVVPAPARRRWWRLGPAPVAAAATVALVAAGGLYLRLGQPPDLPRGVTSGNEVTRSLAVGVRGPIGDLVEAPRRLQWLAVDRAVSYRVRLMEVDRREVWSETTSALEVELPSDVRASLAPGRTLLWDVTGYDSAGAAIAESGLQSFHVVLR